MTKLLFISDIHGSIDWLNRAMDKAAEEQADQIVVLGDVLYHGPRNALPEGYQPQEVAAALNSKKEQMIAVRGNCDAEVDQMMLEFPIMADYAMLYYEGRHIYATHGHLFSMDNLPPLSPNAVFIQGHTHLPVAEKRGSVTVLNPGSIALPKGGFPHSYGVLEGLDFQVKDFEGNLIMQVTI